MPRCGRRIGPDLSCLGSCSCRQLPRDLNHNRAAFAFAALREPRAEAFRKTLGREAKAGFDLAVAHWKGIVKIGGVGEVAHAELIEPIERAGAALAANQDVHFEFLGVHEPIITSRR
jgi:hypothetical protein